MKKSFIVIVVAGALGLALIGISATRWLHVVASQQATVASAAPKVLVPARPRAGDAAQNRIVRFASNAVPAPPFLVPDLDGHAISTADWHGKVVLLNFWATWCPPCRKEMPDLEALYDKYKDQGFLVLAISDEEAAKVSPFISQRQIRYPVLLDPGDKVHQLYAIEGIPKSFVYDRAGKLVAQSIDMRTRRQFQDMIAQAGLQ
jgi:peroxiredoxin